MKLLDPNVAEAREWIAKAVDDLESAQVLAGTGHEGNALYFGQQTAEKSLKAFLTAHARAFRKTHDLGELGEACAGIDPSMAPLADAADVLTDYAWRLRYPGEPYEVEPGEVASMLELAGRVLDAVRTRIEGIGLHPDNEGPGGREWPEG